MSRPGGPPKRPCARTAGNGAPCRAAALVDGRYCFLHDPEHAEAAAAARRIGGLRRRRTASQTIAFDLGDIRSLDGLWRMLEVTIEDTLALDNGIARNRTLVYATSVAGRLLAGVDLDARVSALESTRPPQLDHPDRSRIEGTLVDGPDLDGPEDSDGG